MRTLILAFCFLLASLPAFGGEKIRMAVSLDPPQDNNAKIIEPTLAALSAKLGKENLEIVRLSLPALEEAILTNQIDIFLSTSGLSRRMAQKGARDLVTLQSSRLPDPNKAYGTLYIARKDAPYESLSDLKGVRLAANLIGGFYGYQIGLGELAKRGFNPEAFFSSVSFHGRDLHRVVEAVINGSADAGSLSSCFLEDNFAADDPVWQKIKPVGVRSRTPCLTSTALYPNWSVSTTPSTTPEISKIITKTLLEMPPAEDGLQWSIATDFAETDRLFKDLKIGPFQFLTTWFRQEFMARYALWVEAAVLFALLLGASNFVLQRLVRRRTRALTLALAAQKDLRREADEANRRLEKIQRLGVIEQMGSMIAHELRQPLSVISAYTHAATTRVRNGEFSDEEASEILNKIQKQTDKAEGIVERVRNYARGKDDAKVPMDLSGALQKSLRLFVKSDRFHGALSEHVEGSVMILGSTLEIEIALQNLLQNAADAVAGQPVSQQSMAVALSQDGTTARLSIRNSGPIFAAKDVEAMLNPLYTTHAKGLGLGLPIVQNIVRRHGGRFRLIPNPKGGICAEIELPTLA